jgi:hypothetical protein
MNPGHDAAPFATPAGRWVEVDDDQGALLARPDTADGNDLAIWTRGTVAAVVSADGRIKFFPERSYGDDNGLVDIAAQAAGG